MLLITLIYNASSVLCRVYYTRSHNNPTPRSAVLCSPSSALSSLNVSLHNGDQRALKPENVVDAGVISTLYVTSKVSLSIFLTASLVLTNTINHH